MSVEMTREERIIPGVKPSMPDLFAQALVYERKING